MYEELSKITVGGNELPIKCDINILGLIQETYHSLTKFEQKLIGLEPILDENGNPTYKDDGTLNYSIGEPSYSVLAFVLPLFIHEGIMQAKKQGEDYSDVDYREALNDADFNYVDVALAIYNEFERCFRRKKKMTNTKSKSARTKKSPSKSTS